MPQTLFNYKILVLNLAAPLHLFTPCSAHYIFFERTGTWSAYFIDIEEVYSRDPAQKLQVL
jgi:hypothetical protein